jgi:hypothetical protein
MSKHIDEMDIMQIENETKVFGPYQVKRINSTVFTVIKDNTIVFEGEDYEVAEYLNDHL